MRCALVDKLTVRNAIGMVIPRRTGNTTVQSTYTMTDLQYDVNSTMLDVVLPTVAPVAQRVVSDWTEPPPLPEPNEAVFETDGHSCTDSAWFDEDVVREITHRADVDPTFALGGWNIQLEIKDEVSDQTNVENYSIEPDYSPHAPLPTCSSVTSGPCGHSICQPMPDKPISICSHGQLSKLDKYCEKESCIKAMMDEYSNLDKRKCWRPI